MSSFPPISPPHPPETSLRRRRPGLPDLVVLRRAAVHGHHVEADARAEALGLEKGRVEVEASR